MLELVIVQEQLGQLTNALWDMVWRPANALRACDEAQRERYLLPGIGVLSFGVAPAPLPA